jgi:hypothetical protein
MEYIRRHPWSVGRAAIPTLGPAQAATRKPQTDFFFRPEKNFGHVKKIRIS